MKMFNRLFCKKSLQSDTPQMSLKVIKSPIILNCSKVTPVPKAQKNTKLKIIPKVSLETAVSANYPQDPHAHFLFLEAAIKGTAELGGAFYSIKSLKEVKNINSKDRRGYTPLQDAASQGLVSVVEELLQAGADVNAVTPENLTALHLATINGHKKVVAELLEHGANKENTLEDFFN